MTDYNNMLSNFGFGNCTSRCADIKEMIKKEFQDKIGFKDGFHKKESTIVYDTKSGEII